MSETTTIDMRCPVDSRRLFARVVGEGRIVEGNLVEVACLDCKKAKKRIGEPVRLVLHQFNMLGECVDTQVLT